MSNVREIASNAGERYEELKSFEADQEITAGGMRIKGHVKFRKPRSVAVEYEDYQSPMENFEVKLSGGPEFIGDDLVDSRVVYGGKETWVHLVDKNTAVKKEGKLLYSPFAGVDVIGQLGFLPSLVSDFLLKDEGEGEINGKPVDRLGLKPKTPRRSLFLKEEVFNLERAELALDKELGLPRKITYYPGEGEQLRFSGSQGSPVFVEYSDYELDGLGKRDFQFDPSKVDKVFEEQVVSENEFGESFPLSIPLTEIKKKGYERARDKISVLKDDETGRAYCSITLIKSDEAGRRPTSSVQLLVGNYLSREMSRHRTYMSENGEEMDLEDHTVRLADRAEAVRERLPEEWDQEILEISWQGEESFYYLLGQGIGKDELIDLARDFLS
ncbi:MAG: outer membrane lipoprotein carrier protein LolA [Candidatus Bipolaricaulia bacterium]